MEKLSHKDVPRLDAHTAPRDSVKAPKGFSLKWPRGRVSLVVAMSVCVSVCLSVPLRVIFYYAHMVRVSVCCHKID